MATKSVSWTAEVEALIDQYEKYPCLYNTRASDYHDKRSETQSQSGDICCTWKARYVYLSYFSLFYTKSKGSIPFRGPFRSDIAVPECAILMALSVVSK